MDKLMQSLFNYITDCTLEKYYEPAGMRRYWEERDAIGRAAVLQAPRPVWSAKSRGPFTGHRSSCLFPRVR